MIDWSRIVGKTAYATAYAVVVTAIVSVGLAAVSFGIGFGLTGVKVGQFLVGWLLFGYAAVKLRPKAAWKRDWESDETTSERVGRVERPDDEDDEDRERDERAAQFLSPVDDSDRRISASPDDFGATADWSFRGVVGALPPASLFDASHWPRDSVLFACAAVFTLAASFALEALFGV